MEYNFYVQGKPIPWDKKKAPGGHIYKSPDLKAWQETVGWTAKEKIGPKGLKLQGPLSLVLTF